MRLVRRTDSGRIGLTNDLGKDGGFLRYAILSHTWARDNSEEVAFEDKINGTDIRKPGYDKI
jgi:hypothetical protein